MENHAAATALNYFAYNFIKIHRPLRTSPAMAAGATDRLWGAEDLVALGSRRAAEGGKSGVGIHLNDLLDYVQAPANFYGRTCSGLFCHSSEKKFTVAHYPYPRFLDFTSLAAR